MARRNTTPWISYNKPVSLGTFTLTTEDVEKLEQAIGCKLNELAYAEIELQVELAQHRAISEQSRVSAVAVADRLDSLAGAAQLLADVFSPHDPGDLSKAAWYELREAFRSSDTSAPDEWPMHPSWLATELRTIGRRAGEACQRVSGGNVGHPIAHVGLRRLIKDVVPLYERITGRKAAQSYARETKHRPATPDGPFVRFIEELSRHVYGRSLEKTTIGSLVSSVLREANARAEHHE